MSIEGPRRTNQVKLSLTHGESKALDGRRGEVPRGVAARALMLDGMERPGPWTHRMLDVGLSDKSLTEVIRLRRELNRVGVNLNQLVQQIHTGGVEFLDAESKKLLWELLNVHADICDALEVILDEHYEDADDEQG